MMSFDNVVIADLPLNFFRVDASETHTAYRFPNNNAVVVYSVPETAGTGFAVTAKMFKPGTDYIAYIRHGEKYMRREEVIAFLQMAKRMPQGELFTHFIR